MMKKIVRMVLTVALLLPALVCEAVVNDASEIEPPTFGFLTTSKQTKWFADPDRAFARNLRREIDDAITVARDSAKIDLVVVYLYEYDGDLKTLAKDIHDRWHLGSISGFNDNGVVLLVVGKGDKAYIYTGLEASQKLPGTTARLIESRRIKPKMRKGDDTQAIIDGVNSIKELILNPDAAEQLKDEPEGYEDINVWWIGGLCLATLLIAIIYKIIEKRKKQE